MVDGMHLELFTGLSCRKYLEEMSKSGTYSDEITLSEMANLFNAEIVVISTPGEGGMVIIIVITFNHLSYIGSIVCIGASTPLKNTTPPLFCQAPCTLRLVETFWIVETFVSGCLNFN